MVTRLPALSSARRARPTALQARRQDEAVHRRAHRPHHRGPPRSIKLIPPSKKRRTPFFSGRGTYLGVRVDRSTKTDRRALAKRIIKQWERQVERGEYRTGKEVEAAPQPLDRLARARAGLRGV